VARELQRRPVEEDRLLLDIGLPDHDRRRVGHDPKPIDFG
jgi:hypothetical protein